LATADAVTVGWVTLIGWIPLGLAAHKAAKLHDAWSTLWEQYETFKRENEDEAKLIEFVSKLVGQFHDVDAKAKAAEKAVGTLSEMFQQQGDSCRGIQSNLGFVMKRTTSADARNRQFFIASKLRVCIAKLKELKRGECGLY
jgi:hypothetical protein